MEEPDTRSRRRRRWWLLGAVLLIGGVVGGWVIARQIQSPDQAASRAEAPEPSWITASVERRVLAQTVISRGDVRPEVAINVGPPSSIDGDPVVTGISVATGDEVGEGTRLVEVSGRPVIVLQGDVPVYRSLKPGMAGADVAQLQAALTRLGCDTAADAGSYGEATKACVAKLYNDAGYDPIPTTATEAADITAAEQTLADAQAAADSAQIALDTALKGPSDLEVLNADTAVDAAERNYNDAVAGKQAAVDQAQTGINRAQAALDQLGSSPEATPADVSAAQAELDAAKAALDTAVRSGDAAIATANDAVVLARAARADLDKDPDVTVEFTALGQAFAARDRAQAALDSLRASVGPTVPQGEIVFAPTLPARVQNAVTTLGPPASGQGNPGAGAGNSTAGSGDLVTLAAGDLVVSMTLRPNERQLVRVGMSVELLDEQSNATYDAAITEIAETSSSSANGQAGVPVVMTPNAPLPETLSGANLRVTITAASTDTATLVVPLAAVSSSADGSTNVSILRPNDNRDQEPVVVAVTAGLSADGFVAVEPVTDGALKDGYQVVVGR